MRQRDEEHDNNSDEHPGEQRLSAAGDHTAGDPGFASETRQLSQCRMLLSAFPGA